MHLPQYLAVGCRKVVRSQTAAHPCVAHGSRVALGKYPTLDSDRNQTCALDKRGSFHASPKIHHCWLIIFLKKGTYCKTLKKSLK